jgi:hypothetical protein
MEASVGRQQAFSLQQASILLLKLRGTEKNKVKVKTGVHGIGGGHGGLGPEGLAAL